MLNYEGLKTTLEFLADFMHAQFTVRNDNSNLDYEYFLKSFFDIFSEH
jgi:hypothetical protein